ncbi:MAG: hypothetical protein GY696_16385 [Gammaproteobacteria bacterium]|nr:hypothetical protein [Gammaproteobacteria bacterium]
MSVNGGIRLRIGLGNITVGDRGLNLVGHEMGPIRGAVRVDPAAEGEMAGLAAEMTDFRASVVDFATATPTTSSAATAGPPRIIGIGERGPLK